MSNAADSDPPPLTLLASLVFEFAITVALGFPCHLAIVQILRYPTSSCSLETSCAERYPCRVALYLAALSPLDVLKATIASTLLVFLGMYAVVRITNFMSWSIVARSSHTQDVEARAEDVKVRECVSFVLFHAPSADGCMQRS